MATIIKTTKTSPLAGTAGGRPVRFSLAAWGWYYVDTPPAQAAEKVRGMVLVMVAA
jgi:hypothetical protein